MHKSLQIWGWFLPKKIDLPTQRGRGRSGNFRGSKNQKSGKCHELSRKSINLFLPIPPRGGGGGSRGGGWRLKFQMSGKFHELSRKSIKKFTPPTKVGILGGQKIKSPRNVMNCPENQYNLFLPIPPWGGGSGGGGGCGSKFQKSGKFHELLRKSITIFLPPPPTKGGRSGN